MGVGFSRRFRVLEGRIRHWRRAQVFWREGGALEGRRDFGGGRIGALEWVYGALEGVYRTS